MISLITLAALIVGIPGLWFFIYEEFDNGWLGTLGALSFGVITIVIGLLINWFLSQCFIQETPNTYIETQPVIAQYSILEDDYIVPTSSGTLRIPIKQTIIQPSGSAELETHYLQRKYSDGAKFVCAPFAVDGPVIDYYVLKINNS